MDDQVQTRLDGAETIRNLLLTAFANTFNAYFIGKPDFFPEAVFPCIVIQKIQSSYRASATMTDDVVTRIQIHVLANGKIGWGTPDDDDTAMRTIYNIVEARDPTSGFLLKNTIVATLRQNITFTSTIIDNDIDVNYDITDRSENQLPELVEGIVTVETTERVFFPNRT